MGLLKVIEWKDESRNTIVYRLDMKNDFIAKGSSLTVRESQAAVFCDKGKMADVFLPGIYKLDTNNIPLLTKLMSWKYGFESPFKSDVYFVNTKQFPNQKWGTQNPIIIRDADYGAVRVRAFGTYSFKVSDPFYFLKELSGTNSSFKTNDITDWLRSMVVTRTSDIIGESKIPILDMAGNLVEMGDMVEKQLNEKFESLGVQFTNFCFENFSMPEALEKALDESTSLGMLGKNMNTYMMKAQADALKAAASNQGAVGGTMGAGLGMGMGMGMGNMFAGMTNGMGANMDAAKAAPAANTVACGKCGAKMNADAKFCPECGATNGTKCPKCNAVIKSGAKFCPECGAALVAKCPKCGAALDPGTKFCGECGAKV